MIRPFFSILTSLLFYILQPSTFLLGEDRPNIIFFFTDDQAYDTLGVYGNPNVKTPNIDSLGKQGVIFDRHYDTTAICMASRANVMTGLYEYKSGTNFMHGPMSKEIWSKSFPVLLQQAGYRTGFGGKFGFPVVEDPTKGGRENKWDHLPDEDFDFWVGGLGQTSYDTAKNKYLARFADQYPHSSRAYGAAGQEFIKDSVKSGDPFCLSIFFKAPHRPVQPDPMFDDVYKDTVFRKLPNYGRKAGEHLSNQSRMGRQYPRFKSWGYSEEASYQKALRLYNQQIHGVDYAIGMIVDELERQGVADNAVIIFSSDNGFFNGSHGLGSKVLPYEEGARVPLIIYDPRYKSKSSGRRVPAVTGNVDLAATILDLAGVETPEVMDGRSLMPIVSGETNSVRTTVPIFNVWGTQGTTCMTIVTETHKYVYWPYGEEFEPAEELFDLKNDPYELKNVISETANAAVLESLRNEYKVQLDRWKTQAVPYNNYQQFGVIFDPSVPWSDKKSLFPTGWASGIRYYTEEIAN
jgi:arylsulfatase A-like enzyme